MATQDDLIARTLHYVGEAQDGQTVSLEQGGRVLSIANGVFAKLSVKDVVYLPDTYDIQDAALEDAAIILAEHMKAYGVPRDEVAIENARRQLLALKPVDVGETVRACYF